jgi:hypothetical protein
MGASPKHNLSERIPGKFQENLVDISFDSVKHGVKVVPKS